MREPGNKGKTYDVTVVTAAEFGRLLAQIDGESATAIRDRAMLLVLYRAALRVSEVVALRPGDVDAETGRLRVVRGKGGRSRTVGLDTAATRALSAWLAKRDELDWSEDAYLFGAIYSRGGGKPGGKLHPSHLRRLIARLARAAGINRRVHPHALRHSRAHELATGGVPVSVVQKALGHRSLQTTSTYLDHVSAADVVAAMRD
jgi:integrase